MPTTARCPDFAYIPTESATVVTRLESAGATLLGKTNLDQFATGLVGTHPCLVLVGHGDHPHPVDRPGAPDVPSPETARPHHAQSDLRASRQSGISSSPRAQNCWPPS